MTAIDHRPQNPGPLDGQPPNAAERGATGVLVLCTYCGSLSSSTSRCTSCGGHFDLLSRQRTQNGMGPWFIRDEANPFHPGCSYETLRRLVARGRVRPDTVIRGPTTRQFWSFARNTPGVAHLLGACHACHAAVDPLAVSCPSCNASFIVASDRQVLGLAPQQLLPGDADPSAVADAAFGPASPPVAPSQPAASPQPAPAEAPPAQRPPIAASRPRRRSAGPMIAVAASVACAAVALTAIVMMNRSPASGASASAAEPDPVSRADTPDLESGAPAPPSRPAESAGDTEARIDLPADDVAPERPEPAETADADPVPSGADDQPPTQQTRDSEIAPAEVSGAELEIATMSVRELEEARLAWSSEGRQALVAAADRRLQQLRLREMFESQVRE